MHLLLIHQNFPGQFRDLAPAWLQEGHQVSAISAADPPSGEAWSGLIHYGYEVPEPSSLTMLRRGKIVGQVCRKLQMQGLIPDLVLAHSGWGEALQLRRVWGKTPIIVMPELWGSPEALGIGFDSSLDGKTIEGEPFLLPNLVSELSIVQANEAFVASRSQLNSFPTSLRNQLTLLPEGLNLSKIQPNSQVTVELPQTHVKAGEPVVTFVSRQLEPLRGLRQILSAWPEVSRAHPQAQLLFIGDEFNNGYGVEAPNGESHLQDGMALWDEQVDRNRVHHLGYLKHQTMLEVLQCSACHLALSYPYTLSWSVLEAMACGAPLVTNLGSPIEAELIHNQSCLVVPFEDAEALAAAILQLLNNPDQRRKLAEAGRNVVEERFNLQTSLKQYEQLFHQFQGNNVPAAHS